MCFGLGVCVWLSISDGSCLKFSLNIRIQCRVRVMSVYG